MRLSPTPALKPIGERSFLGIPTHILPPTPVLGALARHNISDSGEATKKISCGGPTTTRACLHAVGRNLIDGAPEMLIQSLPFSYTSYYFHCPLSSKISSKIFFPNISELSALHRAL